MSDVTRVIGIDFGTSTSVVCVKRYQGGKPVGDAFLSSSVTFGNGQGDTRAVTAVRRNGDGTCTCGREAEDPAPEAEIFREFKMDLENPDEGKRAQARALTEEFFKYLYRWYDHQRSDMGGAGDREKTLVSFPAKWSEDTRRFMAEAAKKAGFPDVSVMDEPSAALYATLTRKMNDVSTNGFLRIGKPGYMLLIDMGAGTTDLAVCRYSVEAGAAGVIQVGQIHNEIVSTWPESAGAPTFGGREVDRLLEGYLTDYVISCGLDMGQAKQLVCGNTAVKTWKEDTVSARLNDGAPVDSCGFLSGIMMFLPQKRSFPAIDRAKFEGLLAEKLEDFKSLVTGCLDRASEVEPAIAENGVDFVVLTGGHSVWYFTEALLNGTMPGVSHPALRRVQAEKARVMRLSNPQETVALGLVYSMLPMKVEKETEREQEKDATELVNVLNRVIEKKAEENTTYAYTPHQREVIREPAHNGDAFPHRQENRDIPLKQAGMLYAWDDRLLPEAKYFIKSNRQPWPDLFPDPSKMEFFRMRLGIPMNAEIYLAHTWSVLNMNLGRNGWAITDQGIYCRDNLSAPTYASWQQFLNGTLRTEGNGSPTDKWRFVLLDNRGREHTLYVMKTGLEDSVSDLIIRLQAYLQKESLALQGGN